MIFSPRKLGSKCLMKIYFLEIGKHVGGLTFQLDHLQRATKIGNPGTRFPICKKVLEDCFLTYPKQL